jgi:hypothetical protein
MKLHILKSFLELIAFQGVEITWCILEQVPDSVLGGREI